MLAIPDLNTWLECNNEFVGNKEYFDELADVCKNDEALSAFYHYLIAEVSNEDIDFQKSRPIIDFQKSRPITAVKNCKE
jgi:hypothetical protein